MQTIIESERKLEVTKECDVLVCGGGVAGVAAAISAARNGAKVILVEREYGLGGLATLGLITIYLPMCDGLGHQAEYGLVEELLKLSMKHGAEMDNAKLFLEPHSVEERAAGARMCAQYNPHFFSLEMEKMLVDLGVDIQYGTLVCNVTKKGNKIDTVIVENKSGRCAIRCKTCVDATGDSYVIEAADAKRALYGGTAGLASWYYYTENGEVRLRMFGLSDVVPESNQSSQSGDQNEVDNVIEGSRRYQPLDADELSRMVIDGHKAMMKDMLEHKTDGNKFAPTTISQIPLIRMTKRIDGEYVMDDTEIRVTMEDSIGTIGDWRKRGPVYELPFRTLYSSSVPNLIAAGRNISVTDAMWDITRVIPPCVVTGEAAGTAAAMTDDFVNLDVKELQKKLVAQGVRLHYQDIEK